VASEQDKRHAARLREEKLQSDIFILKKLNSSFALFNDALQDTRSANQVGLRAFRAGLHAYVVKRIAVQLEQTEALLNKYVDILAKSETFAQLIFDEQWQGAEAVRWVSYMLS